MSNINVTISQAPQISAVISQPAQIISQVGQTTTIGATAILSGPTGLTGETGATGAAGAAGEGVPIGGTTGQVLAKNSNTNFDTEWVDNTGGSGISEELSIAYSIAL